MPIMKAAVKHLRQSVKRRKINRIDKDKLRKSYKEGLKLGSEGKKEELAKKLPEIYKLIDKAAKKNLLHKNNAARKKSRLAHLAASK